MPRQAKFAFGIPRPGTSIRVWDVGVRAFHWMLVVAVAAAALTGFILGRTALAWHLASGVAVIIVVVWRIVWGTLGSTYARFGSFVFGPTATLAHVLGRGQHRRHLGHNPLGAMMVFALLAVLMAIGLTGAISLGGLLKQGPLRAFLFYATGQRALTLHNLLAILLMAMIGAHIGGVAFESWRGRENLIAAMLTGDKRLNALADTGPPARGRPWLALAITLAVLAAFSGAIVALTSLPGRLVPPAEIDPVFALQCGACHLAYPPSLAPTSTWNGILADLEHHFGADASLSSEQVTHIRDWLDANAAGHWDTLPSHLFRIPAANGSLRITDTQGWRRRHRHIPETAFSGEPVEGRANCAACHADAATGRFEPQDIAIPDKAGP